MPWSCAHFLVVHWYHTSSLLYTSRDTGNKYNAHVLDNKQPYRCIVLRLICTSFTSARHHAHIFFSVNTHSEVSSVPTYSVICEIRTMCHSKMHLLLPSWTIQHAFSALSLAQYFPERTIYVKIQCSPTIIVCVHLHKRGLTYSWREYSIDKHYIILQWMGFYTLSILPMHCNSFASYALASRWLQLLQNIVGRGKKNNVDTRNSETNTTCAKLDVPARTLASCTSAQSPQHHTHSRSLRQVPSMPFCSRILPRTDTRQYRSSNGTNSARAYSIQLSPSCSAFLPNT